MLKMKTGSNHYTCQQEVIQKHSMYRASFSRCSRPKDMVLLLPFLDLDAAIASTTMGLQWELSQWQIETGKFSHTFNWTFRVTYYTNTCITFKATTKPESQPLCQLIKYFTNNWVLIFMVAPIKPTMASPPLTSSIVCSFYFISLR